MYRTVEEHIRDLEERLHKLDARSMRERRTHVADKLASEIRAVELALSHYRAALQVEQRLDQKP